MKAPSMWNTLQGLAALHFSSSFMDISVGKKMYIRAEHRQPESPATICCSAYTEVAFPTIKESLVRTEFIYLPGIERHI